jgi:hypothetical protein
VPALIMALPATTGYANVFTDWDATGVAIVQGNAPHRRPGSAQSVAYAS